MKKVFIMILLISAIFAFTAAVSFSQETAKPAAPPTPAAQAAPENKLEICVKNMAKIQTLIEYFYLQSGIYPENLELLSKSYNTTSDKNLDEKEMVQIPKDPATGKNFAYKFDKKNPMTYVLSIPDPKLYGVEKIDITPIDWGWMKTFAGEERRKWGISLCVDLLKRLATDVEIYASENKKQFPKDLDTIIKAKLDVPEVLTCPVCTKKYIYELNKDNSYIIKCADPAAHKLKQLEYDSLKGVVGK